ncbi:hypothetical protein NDU88_002832 [Pleurodeles waltl]|uniref:Uncharacterized protein n=1 Tax=Pleurodeles waltl TaxID=8319 RepID=A0AAV7VBN7_PLEWA|nr:hypothetical protein NDU88_002832 [Pleurodeles waltl]
MAGHSGDGWTRQPGKSRSLPKEAMQEKREMPHGAAPLHNQALQEREEAVRAVATLGKEGPTQTRPSDFQSDRESLSDAASYSSLDTTGVGGFVARPGETKPNEKECAGPGSL